MTFQTMSGQGPPGDIGAYQMPCTVLVFNFTFSGTTYISAIRAGDRGWVLVSQGTVASTTIQAAIVYANTVGGEVILNGVFTITVQIIVYRYVTLEGFASLDLDTSAPFVQSTLVASGLADYVLKFEANQYNTGIKIRNINIQGDGTGGQGGIYANGAIKCIFEHIYVYNVPLYALRTDFVTGATIGYHNQFNDVYAFRCGSGFYEIGTDENTWFDCISSQCAAIGFTLAQALSTLVACKVIGWPGGANPTTVGFSITGTGEYTLEACLTDYVGYESVSISHSDNNIIHALQSYHCSQIGAGAHADVLIHEGLNTRVTDGVFIGAEHLNGVLETGAADYTWAAGNRIEAPTGAAIVFVGVHSSRPGRLFQFSNGLDALPSSATTRYFVIGFLNATEAQVNVGCPAPLLLRNMYVKVTNAPGLNNSWIFTIRSNAGSTGITVTLTGAGAVVGSDTANEFHVHQGDLLCVQVTGVGTPTGSTWCSIMLGGYEIQ